MKNFRNHFLLLAILILAVTACKNRHNSQQTTKVKGLTEAEIIQKHKKARADFNYISFKGKAHYEVTKDGKTSGMGFSYKINIAKDSLLWMSGTKLGIPAATVLIDQDSMKVKISLMKTAMLCDFSMLSKTLGMDVNFGMIQSLFTGDPDLDLEKMKLDGSHQSSFKFDESRPPYQLSWFLNASNYKLDKMVVEDPNLGRESTVTYSDFKTVSGYKIPGKVVIVATSADHARIELEHSSIEIEPTKKSFKFRIPKSYDISNCEFKQ